MNTLFSKSVIYSISIILTTLQTPSALAMPKHVNLPEALVKDDSNWDQKLNEDNIQVFVKEVPDSSVKAFKATTTLKAPIDNVLAVMTAPNSCVEWLHGCIISYGLDAESFNERHVYSVNDLPWPATDRDYVLLISTWREPAKNQIWMEMHAVNDKKPPQEEYERVTSANTVYIFEPTNQNTTHVTWFQHTEPGGVLPDWLIDALLLDIPFKSLKKLATVANRSKYRNAEIVTDDRGQIIGVKTAGKM
ncbi:MAG: lipid-binding protein [Gammaproteobacteria bacterium]|nr:MAG: lipid-binding protein [Gammaproteobacteria bacterium]